ncbi:DUF4426 domain-containing protein [Luteimonas aquatica]|uniref:DUF4426 domain-containing protein n=1 Tax=Luteimonas aquatica TaxID=450364 RepID=UPI001F5A7571|nr:DUF4426 domain-containing protein [Luteimonas aquatica]
MPTPDPAWRGAIPRFARVLPLFCALLGACGGGQRPEQAREQADAQAREEAVVRAGDVLVRANAIPTSLLGEAVAREYGIARADNAVMLLVVVRRVAGDQETALPARVTASASDLLGKRQEIALREVRSGLRETRTGSESPRQSDGGSTYLDYVGVATVIAPDTLRFDIAVDAGDGRRARLQFNRDFFPR